MIFLFSEENKDNRLIFHHSRDSIEKQWSETKVLVLRGLLKLLKTSSRFYMCRPWFQDIWNLSLDICKSAIIDDEIEVSLASVEIIFGMLFITIEVSNEDFDEKTLNEEICMSKEKYLERIELYKLNFWQSTLQSLLLCSILGNNRVQVSSYVSEKCYKLYSQRKNFEFRYNQNILIILKIILMASRSIQNDLVSSNGPGTINNIEIKSFQNTILDFLSELKTNSQISANLFVEVISEIYFGAAPQIIFCQNNLSFFVHGSNKKIRSKIGEILFDILNQKSISLIDSLGLFQLIFRKYICIFCSSLYFSKSQTKLSHSDKLVSFKDSIFIESFSTSTGNVFQSNIVLLPQTLSLAKEEMFFLYDEENFPQILGLIHLFVTELSGVNSQNQDFTLILTSTLEYLRLICLCHLTPWTQIRSQNSSQMRLKIEQLHEATEPFYETFFKEITFLFNLPM